MPKCPKCGEKIEVLENNQSGIKTWEFDGENYEEKDFFPDDKLNSWNCPDCDEELFYSEDDARKFLKGVDKDGSTI